MDKDLIENWNLRNDNYVKDILLATIINKGASFGCLYEDPFFFKYMSDAWFEKHRRTFEKWFEAYDLPYQPLRNHLSTKRENQKTSEDGNIVNSYKDNKDVNATHIGDKFSNEDLNDKTTKEFTQNETIDNDTTKGFESAEITDKDTSDTTVGKGNEATQSSGNKDYTNEHTMDRDQDVTTAFDHTDKTTYTDRETTRTPSLQTETRVSAYNAGDKLYDEDTSQDPPVVNKKAPYYDAYAPSELVLNNGSEKTKETGDVSVNHKTNNDEGANLVHTDETINSDTNKYDELHREEGTSHNDYDESKVGSEDKTVRTSSNEQGTNDTVTDTKYNDQTSDLRNVQTTSNDKYNDSAITKSDGTNETKSNNVSDKDIATYMEGLMGGTSYQTLLEKEVNVQMFTIYDQMAELFCDEMCVRIYLSNRQRGGCCIW